MQSLTSYKGDAKLKELFVDEMVSHRKQDQIVQGTYGEENGKFKGCAVGCGVHTLNTRLGKNYSFGNHSAYETELGIPEWLARLEDTIFEGLTVEESKKWPEQFAKAIPVGVNLEPVKREFCAYLIRENIKRVKQLEISPELKEQVIGASKLCLKVNTDAIKTGVWDESAAESAARSARSAARSAESAAESAAWSAARSAARSAESAARSAAWSAARSAESAAGSAWSAARSAESAAWSAWSAAESAESVAWSAWSAAYTKHANKLLVLLAAQKDTSKYSKGEE